MDVYETYHLVLGAVIAGIVAWVFLYRRHLSFELVITGCALNFYLMLLQRYNRARLSRAIARMMASKRPNNLRIQASRHCEPFPSAAVSRRLILG
jgi:predicted membrane metal-binding protein